MLKNTKIVATLGPASDEYTTLKKMVQAGMNVARLNFSHGTYEHHEKILKNVRKVSKDLGVPITILQDLQGPKIRVGKLEEPIKLKKREIILLCTNKKNSGQKLPSTAISKDNHNTCIPVQYKPLPKEVSKGTTIYINDGLIELKVLKTNKKDRIECKVVSGGVVSSHKGMNIVGGKIAASTITAKDKRDLAWGIKNKVDYVALSFVKNAADMKNLKKRLEGTGIKTISKIERVEAVQEGMLEEIIKASDAVMVARGDLGVEMRPEYVPLLQKRIIHISNIHARPVITATQMLQSMIDNPTPTRAEVSDIANAILDHTDAVMLSNETSVGKYPVKAVQMMKRIAHVVEDEMKKYPLFVPSKLKDMPIGCANAYAGVKMAYDMEAHVIVVISETGESALEVAKYRPAKCNLVFTKSEKTQAQLALVWGVNRIFCTKNFDKITTQEIIQILKKEKLTRKGCEVVIIDAREKSRKIESITL